MLALSAASASGALVHQWSFDDNLLDSSGSGNHGTFSGGTETYVAGRFGSGISLTAGDAVDNLAATLGSAGGANGDITINMWLNLASTPPNLAYLGGIGGRPEGTASEKRALIQFSSGFYFWGQNGIDALADADSGIPYIADNAWHMYTVTLDFDGVGNVTYSFFIDGDGSFYTPVTVARDLVGSPATIGIGGTSHWGATWAGAVDEFTVWDQALNADQVASLFTTNQIPEPSSALLFGLAGLVVLHRRAR